MDEPAARGVRGLHFGGRDGSLRRAPAGAAPAETTPRSASGQPSCLTGARCDQNTTRRYGAAMAEPLRIALVGSGSMGLNHARVIATGPAHRAGRRSSTRDEEKRPSASPTSTAPLGPRPRRARRRRRGRRRRAHRAPPARLAAAGHRGRPARCSSRSRCARRSQDTETVVAASERAGMPLMCGLLERFNPAVRDGLRACWRSRSYVRASGTRRTRRGSRPAWPGTSWSTTSTWSCRPSAASQPESCRRGRSATSTRRRVAEAEDVVEALAALRRRRHRLGVGEPDRPAQGAHRW